MDERADLAQQQREAIEAEMVKRTLAHERRVARLRSGRTLRARTKKAAAAPTKDFLAIGDSWFDYPLSGNDPSFANTAIAAQLTQLGNAPPLVLNYAYFGQATTAVLTYENQERIIEAVTDPSQWLNGAPDAILASMGGDDLVGDQFAIYLDYQGAGLDVARFQGALASVKASYLDLFALRDAILPGKTVFGHCYDYAVPNGVAPVCAGPWLQPSLEFSGYDLSESSDHRLDHDRHVRHDADRPRGRRHEPLRPHRHAQYACPPDRRAERLGERTASLSGGLSASRVEMARRDRRGGCLRGDTRDDARCVRTLPHQGRAGGRAVRFALRRRGVDIWTSSRPHLDGRRDPPSCPSPTRGEGTFMSAISRFARRLTPRAIACPPHASRGRAGRGRRGL